MKNSPLFREESAAFAVCELKVSCCHQANALMEVFSLDCGRIVGNSSATPHQPATGKVRIARDPPITQPRSIWLLRDVSEAVK
jgi:hypothetical protein